MRKMLILCAVFALSLGIVVATVDDAMAQTRTAYQTGLRMAKRRHAANPQCYAQVFEHYAVLNRYARWRWPTGGRRSLAVQGAYKQELFQRCGVSA